MNGRRRRVRWPRAAGALAVSICCLAGASGTARAAARKILIIGSDVGLHDEDPLQHAVDDARRTAAVLTELAGPQPPELRLLANPSVDEVLGALAALDSPSGAADAIVVYFSGHGDEAAIHLKGGALPLARLREVLAGLHASLKIVIVDACRTAGRRNKGIKEAETFTVALPGAAGRYRGLVMLMASGPGEAAQESARLRGGVFTHFLLSGLRGAADRDGDRRVTLGEAYDFAHGRMLARSVAQTGVAQSPEMRLEIEGSGPLVLTWLDPARSRLRLPAAADAHFYVYEKGSNALAAEAWGRADGETTLALPSGRFIVHRQLGASHGVAEVALPFGGEARLGSSTFTDVAVEEVLARGGRFDVQRSSLAVVAGVVGDADQRRGASLGARFLRTRGGLLWGGGLAAASLAGRTAFNQVDVQRLDAAMVVGWQLVSSRFSAYLLGELTARLERLRLRDRSVDAALPEPERPSVDQRTLGLGPGARLGATVPLALHVALVAEVGARSIGFRERAAPGAVRLAISQELGIESGIAISF